MRSSFSGAHFPPSPAFLVPLQAALAATEVARVACESAWAVHAQARAAFHSQMTNAVDAFKELETKRTSELCDGMRRYTVFLSSMLANLQARAPLP